MKNRIACMILTLSASSSLFSGCGPAETVIPTGELSEAQKAAIKAEDEAIAMEESQGSVNKPKTKRKS